MNSPAQNENHLTKYDKKWRVKTLWGSIFFVLKWQNTIIVDLSGEWSGIGYIEMGRVQDASYIVEECKVRERESGRPRIT